jgi:nickel-dependent lactate racemase
MERTIPVRIGRRTEEWIPGRDVIIPQPRPHAIARNTPEEALASPIGAEPLEAFVGTRRPVVVIPDSTRSWQRVSLMARAVRSRLGDRPVTWIVATGQHRAATEEEFRNLLGEALLPCDTTLSHDCGRVRDTGLRTSRGTPVTLCPEVADAGAVILTGGVIYHDLAGFSGGRKGLIPGVSGRESIRANHALSLRNGSICPEVGCGLLEANPVAEDMAEYSRLCARSLGLFLLNVVPDGDGAPYRYVAGDAEDAWAEGVRIARAIQTLRVPARVGCAVVSCGGHPGDIDLYQATKAVSAVAGALRPGAGLVLCAEGEEGMTAGFGAAMKLGMASREALLEELERNFTIPGFIALTTLRDLGSRPFALVSSLPREAVALPGEVFPTLAQAWEWMRRRIAPEPVLFVGAGNGVAVRTEDGNSDEGE